MNFDILKEFIIKFIIFFVSILGYIVYIILNFLESILNFFFALPKFYWDMIHDLVYGGANLFYYTLCVSIIILRFIIDSCIFWFGSPFLRLSTIFNHMLGNVIRKFNQGMATYRRIASAEQMYLWDIGYSKSIKLKYYNIRVTTYWSLWLHRRRTRIRGFFWGFLFFGALFLYFFFSYYLVCYFRYHYVVTRAHFLRLIYCRYLFSFIIRSYPDATFDKYRELLYDRILEFADDLLDRIRLCHYYGRMYVRFLFRFRKRIAMMDLTTESSKALILPMIKRMEERFNKVKEKYMTLRGPKVLKEAMEEEARKNARKD